MSEEVTARRSIIKDAIAVITKPASFYRAMPVEGGMGEPIFFLAVMVVVGFFINLIGTWVKIMPEDFGPGLILIVIGPILMVLFSFVAAAILFIIWKIIGSKENYETSYRCFAYSSAISPLTSILAFIPYIGIILAIGWFSYLLIVASIQVHKIRAAVAWVVWGIVGVLLIGLNVSMEIAMQREGHTLTREAQEFEKMQKDLMEELEETRKGMKKESE